MLAACDDATRPTDGTADGSASRRERFLEAACRLPHEWVERVAAGTYRGAVRGSDLVMITDPPHYAGGVINTSHSGPYDFLQEVPLIFHGPGFVEPVGDVDVGREVTLADLPETYSRLMGFDFPDERRDGAAIPSIFRYGEATPKLIVTAVIDGGGWNVLRHWPNAWPNLARLIDSGASVKDAVVGSSPSITPAIHTNLATGSLPYRHGVTSILVRLDDGRIVGGFHPEVRYAGWEVDPDLTLRQSTLADLWDRATDNEAKIGVIAFGNYIAGMAGHGTAFPGGDADLVGFNQSGTYETDTDYYRIPAYMKQLPSPEVEIEKVDLMDGRDDDLWRGHAIEPFDATPAFAPWENQGIKALIAGEDFGQDEITDLFYVNYKAPDMAGHKWNMTAPEQKDVIASVDAAIADLVAWLDREVGRDEYVLTITADHGQTPLKPRAWPLNGDEVKADLGKAFDDPDEGIIEASTTSMLFLDRDHLRDLDVTPEDVASYLTGYTIEQNATAALAPRYEAHGDDKLFAAVFPQRALPEVLACTKPN